CSLADAEPCKQLIEHLLPNLVAGDRAEELRRLAHLERQHLGWTPLQRRLRRSPRRRCRFEKQAALALRRDDDLIAGVRGRAEVTLNDEATQVRYALTRQRRDRERTRRGGRQIDLVPYLQRSIQRRAPLVARRRVANDQQHIG